MCGIIAVIAIKKNLYSKQKANAAHFTSMHVTRIGKVLNSMPSKSASSGTEVGTVAKNKIKNRN